MAVNWFEGGRRISKLAMAFVALGGVAYVVFVSEPMPTLSSRGPTQPWFVSGKDCEDPSYARYLWDYDWGGKKRGVVLCFLSLDNGQVPYAVAPTPPEEIAKVEKEDRERQARGEPPPLRFSSPWFYTADAYDSRVQTYVSDAAAKLQLSPEVRERLNADRSAARWRAHIKAFNDALPWVVGLCAFLWALTAILGWIMRGFAGVPKGADFRPRNGAED